MRTKTLAKIVWYALNFVTVGFGFALLISIGSMIMEMMVSKTYLIISTVSIAWIIAYYLFVRYLNKR